MLDNIYVKTDYIKLFGQALFFVRHNQILGILSNQHLLENHLKLAIIDDLERNLIT